MANLRNFWIQTAVDGKTKVDATGPKSKDDGFVTKVYVREEGASREAVKITGRVGTKGLLVLSISVEGGAEMVKVYESGRK